MEMVFDFAARYPKLQVYRVRRFSGGDWSCDPFGVPYRKLFGSGFICAQDAEAWLQAQISELVADADCCFVRLDPTVAEYQHDGATLWTARARLSAHRRSSRTTEAWLVEHGPTYAPAYLRFGPATCSPGWTMDPSKAVRFARRVDAEAAKQSFIDDIGRVVCYSFTEDAHA